MDADAVPIYHAMNESLEAVLVWNGTNITDMPAASHQLPQRTVLTFVSLFSVTGARTRVPHTAPATSAPTSFPPMGACAAPSLCARVHAAAGTHYRWY